MFNSMGFEAVDSVLLFFWYISLVCGVFGSSSPLLRRQLRCVFGNSILLMQGWTLWFGVVPRFFGLYCASPLDVVSL